MSHFVAIGKGASRPDLQDVHVVAFANDIARPGTQRLQTVAAFVSV